MSKIFQAAQIWIGAKRMELGGFEVERGGKAVATINNVMTDGE
jgi:hypothetical protein